MIPISFTLNGRTVTAQVEPGLRLVDLLRGEFRLCGTKESCGQGECGACTVLMNNEAVHSCMILAVQADGTDIVTIEGLADGDTLDPLQEAFIKYGAIQCGYCTPGMIMAAKGLLLANPRPTDDEIKTALGGNICRCTGYTKILQAVKAAAGTLPEEETVDEVIGYNDAASRLSDPWVDLKEGAK